MVLLVLLMPFGAYKIGGEVVNVSTDNVALVLAFTLTLVYLALGGRFPRHAALPLWIALFFLALEMIATIDAINPAGHVRFLVPLLGSIVIFAMFVIFMRDHRTMERVCHGIFAAAVVAVAGATVQGTTGIQGVFPSSVDGSRIGDIPRVVGFIVTHGLYGSIVVTGVLIALVGLLPTPGRRLVSRKMAVFAVGVSIVGILFSQSRSQMLATAGGFAVFAILSAVYLRGRARRAILAACVVVAAALAPLVWMVVELLVSMGAANAFRRFEAFGLAVSLIQANPLSGVGHVAFLELVGGDRVLHNTFLAVGVSTGLPGMVVIFLLMGLAAVRGMRRILARDALSPLAVGLTASLAAIFIEASLYDGLNPPIYWIVMALLMNVPFIRAGSTPHSQQIPSPAADAVAPAGAAVPLGVLTSDGRVT
jgi:O-antigen ligase